MVEPEFVRVFLAELCKDPKVNMISPHKARHTAATGDIHLVQELMGHSQISLTADLYGHSSSIAQKRVANALEELTRLTGANKVEGTRH